MCYDTCLLRSWVGGIGSVPRVLAVLVVLLAGGVADAALQTYTTRAAFNNDFPGLPLEDFEEARVPNTFALATTDPLDSSTNDSVFQPGEILPGLSVETPAAGTGQASLAVLNNFGAPTSKIVGDNADDELFLRFSEPVDVVAFDVFVNWTPLTVTITPYGASGPLSSFVRIASFSTSDFFGIASDGEDITHIHMISQAGSARQVWVDNIAFGEAFPIPEPATLALFAAASLVFTTRPRFHRHSEG